MLNFESSNARIYRDGTYVFYRNNSRDRRNDTRELSVKDRKFSINRRKVRCACVELWQKKKSKHLLFITITCPADQDEYKTARAFNLWLKNLGTNRALRRYVWVKERQENGRLHYHILMDKNYVKIEYLQKAWETAFYNATGIKHTTSNSVRLGDRPIVSNVKAVAKYLTKYCTKSTTSYDSRCYGFSRLSLFEDVDAVEFYQELAKTKSETYVVEPYIIVGRVDIMAAEAIRKSTNARMRLMLEFRRKYG